MNTRESSLVIDSWRKVSVDIEAAGGVFFERLFEKSPSLKTLFKNDLQTMQRQFTNMLNVIINGLEQADSLREPLKKLGETHRGYGAKQADYDLMSECLIETIEQCSQEILSQAEKLAWQKAFRLFSDMMNG